MTQKRSNKCAPISKELRRAIQQSDLSHTEIARQLGVNVKTAARWNKRDSVDDRKKGPTQEGFRVLTHQDEKRIVKLRLNKQINIDACLEYLKDTMPHLTRSTLQRCFVRHGVNNLRILKSSFIPRTTPLKELTAGNTRSFKLFTCQGIDMITRKMLGARSCSPGSTFPH
jgi:transposase-like protein